MLYWRILLGPQGPIAWHLKPETSRPQILWVLCGGCVFCRSLFVSDHSRLSTAISPASECKAICGSCQRIWVWPLNEVPSPYALELKSDPPTSFAEAPLSVSSVCISFPLVSQVKFLSLKILIWRLGCPNCVAHWESSHIKIESCKLVSLILHHFSLMGAKLSNHGFLVFL